jgi:presenilin-like A22 family membrane protease
MAALLFWLVLLEALAYRVLPVPVEEFSVGNFFVAFAAATALLLLVLKVFRSAKFVGAIFDVALFIGVAAMASALIGESYGFLIGAIAMGVRYLYPRVLIFDAVLIAGMAGVVATIAPGFQPLGLVVILAILAVYDIIAVYATGHMVAMASKLLRQKVFFAIIVPARAGLWLTPLKEVERGGGFSFLGTGDLVLPALLEYAAGRSSPAAGIMVAAGALLGLVVTNILFVSQKRITAMPALPPIALGAITGYLIALATVI